MAASSRANGADGAGWTCGTGSAVAGAGAGAGAGDAWVLGMLRVHVIQVVQVVRNVGFEMCFLTMGFQFTVRELGKGSKIKTGKLSTFCG